MRLAVSAVRRKAGAARPEARAAQGRRLKTPTVAISCGFEAQLSSAISGEIRCTYVSDSERGRRNPTITVVEKLAAPFGVSASRLLD